jgi:phosphatidylinositol alpha-mannosyltransferase
LVVGPGSPDKKTYRIITERNIKDVIFVGGVSPTQLVRYYQSSHIFCSPATGKESFGIVLLEAMAAGKPIVASRIGGYSFLLKDGHQGLLVPPKDGLALADALSVLVRNSGLRRGMGERGFQYVQQYSWTRVAQRVMQYYVEVIRLRDRAGIKKAS